MTPRRTSIERELDLASRLDRGIDAIRRGETMARAGVELAEVAELLEVAEALFERGRQYRNAVSR
jgi:hypothetical protein